MASRAGEFYEGAWARESHDPEEAKRREVDAAARRSLEPVSGERLLEIGPGAGGNTLAFAARGARVVALDIAASSLDRVRARAGESGRRILLVRGDAERLPFRNGAFTRAAIFSVLMFTDPRVVFSELARVVAPGGRAAVVEAVAGNWILGAWRRLGRYRGLAHWHAASAIREAASSVFAVREAQGYYGFLPAAFLPAGTARRTARAIDAFLLGLAPDQAWQVRLALERPERG